MVITSRMRGMEHGREKKYVPENVMGREQWEI